jgi:superfamily II DNA or RNA helicase/HKD family nuclease
VESWFEATPAERSALLDLVDQVRRLLDETHRPDGYNIGVNVGAAAGQTVPHLHLHVIPRYRGDMPDPRGGVRHVIPWKGNYQRAPARALATGTAADPFLRHIRSHFTAATDIAIIAAFVQDSGLELIREPVFGALRHGARVRLLTGDYLNITQATALRRMLDWMEEWAAREAGDDGEMSPSAFEARVVEVTDGGTIASFHPKSWRFDGDGFGVAFVGSSNVSRTALGEGVEWNLRVDRHVDPAAYRLIADAFEGWWTAARPLDAAWVAAYRERARSAQVTLPPGEAEAEPLEPVPEPHRLQREALDALAEARAAGRRRALVVLATGLGKTWLAAFDVDRFRAERGRLPRVLFLAHRSELLDQAAETFRRLFRDARFSWFAGARDDLGGDVVFASVQKLSRPSGLDRLERELVAGAPLYVVVDEVHHATASSYRRILGRLDPDFLLGLTATPDRADEADVVGLFDDNLPYRADLGVGIVAGLLAPFAYHGLRDIVDYANIPWRKRGFDPEVLAGAVQTQARMERLWQAWNEHPARRSLVFCCSIRHSEFVCRWLDERGVRVAAVHSEPGSADRETTLEALERGELEAVCSVDLFNEGIDVPNVDRVVMLRPTESPVVFLQQLGRGLRQAEGKEQLGVIDFVGNHRVFLDRVRLLVSLGPRPVSLREFLVDGKEPELPPGCSIDVELEAIDMLRRFLPSGATEVERAYRDLVAARGERPAAGELYRLGYRPGTLRATHGSWFEFVANEGHLDEAERRVLERAGEWLRDLETTVMEKSFKMVVLETLLERSALTTGLPLAELARLSHAYLMRMPELFRDIEGVKEFPDPTAPDPNAWLAYWRKNPVRAWSAGAGKAWFQVDGSRLVSRLPDCAGDEETLAEMTRELVEYRLAQYVSRPREAATGEPFECVVLSNRRDPILKLPPRAKRPDVPDDETDVRLPDGSLWRFRFMTEFCNVARPIGRAANELPDLLRRWFGPAAGRSGTRFRVRFSRSPDGWWVEPIGGQIIQLAPRGAVVTFPTLRAAAGAVAAGSADVRDAPASEIVRLPIKRPGPDHFAVRAVGDSMDGGDTPIRDGDWLIMRYARGDRLSALEGKVALVETSAGSGEHGYQVKRVIRTGDGWQLRSDNPAASSFSAGPHTVVVAALEQMVHPEDIAPPVGERLQDGQVAAAFGLSTEPGNGRTEGHLFIRVIGPGSFAEPDRLGVTVEDRRPGETAFLLTRTAGEEAWRYGGVGHWMQSDGQWSCPEIDFPSWRALGSGRSASRRLPPGALAQARSIVQAVREGAGSDGWIEGRSKRLRVVGAAEQGGLRIDGGPDGFKERTVSLQDVAWTVVAADDVAAHGGVLDEARVNRLRYLDGTPKAATRWIDTGWALVIFDVGARLAVDA